MAKRYRYAFARQKEAEEGVLSTVLAVVSVVLFLAAVLISFFTGGGDISGIIIGGISVCAMLLAIYGFIQGMRSFSRENRNHNFGIAGAIANGIIMIGWLGLFLLGV